MCHYKIIFLFYDGFFDGLFKRKTVEYSNNNWLKIALHFCFTIEALKSKV